MPIVRAIVTIPMDSALPEDAAQNTFHFVGGTTDQAGADDTIAALADFYNTNGATGFKVAQYLSTKCTGTAQVALYDLGDAQPRVPFAEDTFTISTPTTGDNLPEEVALCLSYQADALSGVSQARRRGRIFIGPLYSAAITQPSARPADNAITALKEAGARLAITGGHNFGGAWCVYSPTANPTGAGESGAAVISNGWVDNAWDTQRRRGLAATTRNTWVAST